jgi:hypothetical protein
LRSAEAARQNAQAAIIDAEARGAMAESQARALEQSIDAVVDLSDDGEYIMLFAGLALAVLVFTGFAGFVIWQMGLRRVTTPYYDPTPQPRQIATITDDNDQPIWKIEQQPQESTAQFLLRLQIVAAQAAQREQALLEAPRQ